MIMRDKCVLITGVCGTVGVELIDQLLNQGENSPAKVIGIDNNESKIFFIDQKYSNNPKADFYISDIRDKSELIRRMRNVDIVLHLAALKHVILCEKSPEQATKTNILGIQNIIESANICDVDLVMFTSSDKAVNPTNVMGATKLMGERLITAANNINYINGQKTRFFSTRFGNVLGSNGSVVPIFYKQIISKKSVTITDIGMTRFVMSIKDAVKLILESCDLAKGGEIFITKMPVVRILDLAKAMMSELYLEYGYDSDKLNYNVIGSKLGEKLFEELMSSEEVRRSIELEKYFLVLPLSNREDSSFNKKIGVKNPYISKDEPCLELEEIKSLLINNNMLEL